MIALVKDDHQVYAMCPKGDFSGQFGHHGIRHINYQMDRGSLNPLKEIIAIKNIFVAIKKLRPDVVHSFTVKPNIYGGIALAFLPKIKLINTITGMGSFYIDTSKKAQIVKKIIESLYKFISKRADITLFQNSDDMRYFYENGLQKSEKCKLIKGSGIDTDHYRPSSKHKNDTLQVLMIARAIWHKGIKEYYEAAQILCKRYDDIEFILIGDTDNANPSCAHESYLQNGKVKWLGSKKNILPFLQKCDIFVLPSYREGIPRTLLEASACAKPMVTCDTIGCKEVVEHGKNGYLVQVGNADDLAKAIEWLYQDETKREEFGIYAREKAINEFDVTIVVKKYLEMYEATV
jgi:N,N'-diacetylbacillosaminyl-diphospho-undecaprenol alpha-1,3-N-acetylgalactosaminyltransferase